jgi:type I restriction enzyme S subunit
MTKTNSEPRTMVSDDGDHIQVPLGWDRRSLGELAEKERGITYGIVQPGHHVSDGVPIVRVQNIVDGTLETSDMMRVAPEIAAEDQRACLCGGELLLALAGSVGSSVVAPLEFAGWNTARAIAIVPLRAGIDARWVRFCLRSAPLQHLMEVWCNTTVQATLNLKDVTRLPIPLSPPREREAIVGVLGALDDKIELNRRMHRTLEELAGALFRARFVDFEPVVAKAAGRAAFGLEHLSRKSICLMEFGTAADVSSGKSDFKREEILFGKLRLYFQKVGVALCDGVCSTDVVVVTPRAEPWFGLLLGHLSSDEFIDHTDAASRGTRMPRTSWHDMKRYRIALPPEPLAQKLAKFYRRAEAMFAGHRAESRTLAGLRDMLLPKLLSGELRMKTAESLAETVT